MMMEPESQPATELLPLNTIRVETALSRYPVHRLARKGSIKIEVTEADSRGEASLKWKVSYNSEYGQPGPLAYKLDTLIINRRIEEARRPIPRMLKLGSLSDICRELNLADSGKNRNDIKHSLYQNAFAGITAKTTYRQADGSETSLETGFTRYSVILTGEKLPDGKKADGVYVVLNDVFIRVINGAMTRPLDYDYLKSLPPAPQRFYELLSYQMYAAIRHDRPRAKLTYSDFCAHAPQTRHFDWECVRSQMNKVLRPHRESGYITRVDYQHTTDSQGRPDWFMFFLPGPKARAEYKAFTKRGGPNVLEIEPLDITSQLSAPQQVEQELVQHGVTATVAAELVRNYPEEKITAQIERVDWLIEKKPEKIAEPAAYLVQAIKNDYAAPKGFVSKAERQRRLEAKQDKERQAAEERRRQREEEDRERAMRKAIIAYWESLTPKQQAELDAESRSQADPDGLAMETGPMKETFQRLRRDQYIRQLLQTHEQPPVETQAV
jgi:hypothetical protein